MGKKTRKFNGKTYKFLIAYETKTNAKTRARGIRKGGAKARVVQGKSLITGKKIWEIYRRGV